VRRAACGLLVGAPRRVVCTFVGLLLVRCRLGFVGRLLALRVCCLGFVCVLLRVFYVYI
ncbi:hypothetical protein V1506DRAFT_542170, partial [Lipomyces tetrasporus]